jgi:hypothetical protein
MRKRVILLIAGAAVLALAAAAPVLLAMVRTATPDPYTAPVPFAWTLQLRGAKRINLSKQDFNAFKALKNHQATIIVDENKPATPDTADDTTYRGVPLWRVVGLIDDKNPATFNTKLATKGAGYGVEVMGVDYFSYVYTSQQVAALGDSLMVASSANGMPLKWGSVSTSGSGSFKPSWPLKLVSSDSSVTGKMRPGGILRISIVAAPTPPPSPSPSTSPSTVAAPF